LLKRFLFLIQLSAFILISGVAATLPANAQNKTAFETFVAAGNYENANFYLANGYVKSEDIDTSQLFYTVLSTRYFDSLSSNGLAVDRLYNYLAGLGAIDLNRSFTCSEGETCLLVNDLMHGTKANEIAWFVARGLDLNNRQAHSVPATVPLMLRLGTIYNLNDINWLSTNGMVLGDEGYTIEELLAYRDGTLSYPHELALPTNFLNLGDQNLLDTLVVLLASSTNHNELEESRRRAALCSFISYAASAYTPSFDYLDHALTSIKDFRGVMIGEQRQARNGIYQPFPTACVSLVQSMANSHARLNDIIDRFARSGDVATASWLLSLMQARTQ
jgi:hypothetical protein